MKTVAKVFGLAGSWALIYALPAFPIEALSNLGIDLSFTYAVDLWPMELGLPGFLGGVLFAALLALTGRLRRFEQLRTAPLAGLGALAGALVGGIYTGTAGPDTGARIALIFGLAIGLGALAGPGSALLFRMLARRRGSADARAGA